MRNRPKRRPGVIQVCLLLIWLLAAPAYRVSAQALEKMAEARAAQSGAISRGELILAMNGYLFEIVSDKRNRK